MNDKERAAMQQALEALEIYGEHAKDCPQYPTYMRPQDYPKCNCGFDEAITALREALAEQVEQEPVGRWNWNEAKFEWLTKFDYHKHHMAPLYAAPVQQAEQEPVGTLTVSKYKGYENGSFDYYGDLPVGSHNLYAAPVHTKDLTDDEMDDIYQAAKTGNLLELRRAVIAAYKEKNK